ncbi:aminopeptidase [Brevibacillus dissolubilis]|uniref:aminopeptidase n=1 Tax=Brevibacillus dissolubilis TaxID=1844116 RepID=UPI0011173A5C|nr:aminopeptidase [Brevibacillus dissolubilis]
MTHLTAANLSRINLLSQQLLDYSLDCQKGDRLVIEVLGEGRELAKEIIKEAYARGAHPFVKVFDPMLHNEWLRGITAETVQKVVNWDTPIWQETNKRVVIIGVHDGSDYAGVPIEQVNTYFTSMRELRTLKSKKRWVGLHYPTQSLADNAGMTLEAFTDFYFQVSTIDYAKVNQAAQPLKEWMERTDRVRIIGAGTDLTFSIKGIPAYIASGEMNVPDGEVFTAPVLDSVNGTITYNIPSLYDGTTYSDVRFVFQNGKIIEATANETELLNKILDRDEGARFIGEFAIGFHPLILHPMNDILFDEKIAGSFHFTPGHAIEMTDNGNRSSLHWDLVSIQRPEYGGGEIWFDDVLVRKDGLFVPEELQGLNPDRLMEGQ